MAVPFQLPDPSDEPAILKLFAPPSSDVEDTRTTSPGVLCPDGSWTLRRLYEALILPELGEDQRGTKEAFSGALNHWERRSADPGISAIDDDVRKSFQASMQKDETDYSPDTIRKQWRYLTIIMRAAKAKGLIAEIPRLKKLPTVDPTVRIVPDDQLERFYLACETATWPQIEGIAAPDWWRGSVVMWRIYGPRRNELHNRLPWQRPQTKFEVRKAWPASGIYRQTVCPLSLVRYLTSQHGWLVYTPKKQAWAKPAPLVLPLHPVARAHLDKIAGDRPAVFPRSKANKAFAAQWDRLLEAAAIPPEDRFTPHDLRRTCESEYGGIGPHITGHAKRTVSAKYYRNFAARIQRAIAKVRLPKAFKAILEQPPPDDGRQMKLF